MKRARPDDDGRALVMTPARLASELHRLGEDAAKLQFRLRSLAAFLDREPIELIHDTLRTQACRLVDLATAVRVGEVPIVAHRDESIVQEALPLFKPEAPAPTPEKPRPKQAYLDWPHTPLAAIEGIDDELARRVTESTGCGIVGDLAGWLAVGHELADLPGLRDGEAGVIARALLGYRDACPDAAEDLMFGWLNEEAAAPPPVPAKRTRRRRSKLELQTEHTNGLPSDHQPAREGPEGVDGHLRPVEAGATPDLGASDGPAADPEEWRSIKLATIFPDGLADALNADWELQTLDDLHQALSNGETLEDFVFTPTEAGAIREAVAGVARERNWGPEDGIPLAWLEPKAADDKQDGRPVFACRGCGESWLLENVKGDIPHVCDGCRPDFYLEWLAAVRGIIATELGPMANVLPEIPDKIARHAFRLPLSPRLAAPTIVADLGWTAETVRRQEPESDRPDGTNPVPAEDIDGALHHILHRDGKAGDRWWTLKQSGADDAAIRDALRSTFGTGQKVAFQFQTTCSTYQGGKSPKFWYGWHCGLDGGKPAPTLAGDDLVVRVRELLEIPKSAKAPKTTRSKKGEARAHA